MKRRSFVGLLIGIPLVTKLLAASEIKPVTLNEFTRYFVPPEPKYTETHLKCFGCQQMIPINTESKSIHTSTLYHYCPKYEQEVTIIRATPQAQWPWGNEQAAAENRKEDE
jgi:hypothetical protein